MARLIVNPALLRKAASYLERNLLLKVGDANGPVDS